MNAAVEVAGAPVEEVVLLAADGIVRHAPDPVMPGILCNLDIADGRRIVGAYATGTVNCWACRTIRAGGNPADPDAPARPGGQL